MGRIVFFAEVFTYLCLRDLHNGTDLVQASKTAMGSARVLMDELKTQRIKTSRK